MTGWCLGFLGVGQVMSKLAEKEAYQKSWNKHYRETLRKLRL